MPEILDAFERDGMYYGVIQVEIERDRLAFEFGVHVGGYRALRRVLQERPYHATTSGPYRYFIAPGVSRDPESKRARFWVRIEQGRTGRQFAFDGPDTLVANLMWFCELKDLVVSRQPLLFVTTSITLYVPGLV